MFFLLACVGLGGRDSWSSDSAIGQSLHRTYGDDGKSGEEWAPSVRGQEPFVAWTGMFPSSSGDARLRQVWKARGIVLGVAAACAVTSEREQLRFNSGLQCDQEQSSETTNSHRCHRKGRRNNHRVRQQQSST